MLALCHLPSFPVYTHHISAIQNTSPSPTQSGMNSSYDFAHEVPFACSASLEPHIYWQSSSSSTNASSPASSLRKYTPSSSNGDKCSFSILQHRTASLNVQHLTQCIADSLYIVKSYGWIKKEWNRTSRQFPSSKTHLHRYILNAN